MDTNTIDIRTRNLSPDMIIETVARVTGITRRELLGFDRHAEIAAARHVLAYLLYTDYKATLVAVAEMTGRHHSTIINSLRRFKRPDPAPHLVSLIEKRRASYDKTVRPNYGIRKAG